MPCCRLSQSITAPVETVWALLLDKLEHPQRYLETVLDFAILERGDDHLVRELELPWLERIVERITILSEEQKIVYDLIAHPRYHGRLVNLAQSGEEPGTSLLVTEMAWELRPGCTPPDDDPCEMVRCSMAHVKDIAEELARATV